MKNKVPHNVLTISEMTKRPNRINAEIIEADGLVLTEELIKKLRASSSMFNKSVYVQLLYGNLRFNIERVESVRGSCRIFLISPEARAVMSGRIGEKAELSELTRL